LARVPLFPYTTLFRSDAAALRELPPPRRSAVLRGGPAAARAAGSRGSIRPGGVKSQFGSAGGRPSPRSPARTKLIQLSSGAHGRAPSVMRTDTSPPL